MKGCPEPAGVDLGNRVGKGGQSDFGLGLRRSSKGLCGLRHSDGRWRTPYGARRVDRFLDPDEFPVRVAEPVGAPDAVDLPAQSFQHLLPEPVAVPGGTGAVIAGSVAFDAQQITPWLGWIHDRQVDEETGRSDLVRDIVSPLAQLVGDRFLERGVGLATGGLGQVDQPILRVLQERLERLHPPRPGPPQVQISSDEVAVHNAAPAGPRDEDVQAALASVPVERPEIHR